MAALVPVAGMRQTHSTSVLGNVRLAMRAVLDWAQRLRQFLRLPKERATEAQSETAASMEALAPKGLPVL